MKLNPALRKSFILECNSLSGLLTSGTKYKSNDIKLDFRLRVFNPKAPNEDFKCGSVFRSTLNILNRIYKKNIKII